MTIARELDIILAHGPELSASGLDFYKLGLWAAGLPHSRILSLDPSLPPDGTRSTSCADQLIPSRLPELCNKPEPGDLSSPGFFYPFNISSPSIILPGAGGPDWRLPPGPRAIPAAPCPGAR
jgi:hypothetical protein